MPDSLGARDGAVLREIREALRSPNAAIHVVQTFTHGRALQVKIKSRKIGPLIVVSEGQTLADIAAMLFSEEPS